MLSVECVVLCCSHCASGNDNDPLLQHRRLGDNNCCGCCCRGRQLQRLRVGKHDVLAAVVVVDHAEDTLAQLLALVGADVIQVIALS